VFLLVAEHSEVRIFRIQSLSSKFLGIENVHILRSISIYDYDKVFRR
jgi:hypothetical protein